MKPRIIVQPAEDYFVAFLATRGIDLVAENADVIHYFGTSRRKLKKLVADHDPDLVVIHNKKVFDKNYKFPFALDEVSDEKDIYVPREVKTNALELSRLHFQSLGLERLMLDLMEDIKEERKLKLKINSSSVKKIFSAMMWD
jgi:hypothetical protein